MECDVVEGEDMLGVFERGGDGYGCDESGWGVEGIG
jgi:hypothetical protein